MTVSIEDAKTNLEILIARLAANEELIICDQGQPVAKVTRLANHSWPCQPGSAKDIPHWMAPDFNAPLEDFREYVE